MLTLQTAMGFTLTLVTIHLLPHWVDSMGWRYAFVPLSIGPAIGVYAMCAAARASARGAAGRRPPLTPGRSSYGAARSARRA